jgi:hypothetical protein
MTFAKRASALGSHAHDSSKGPHGTSVTSIPRRRPTCERHAHPVLESTTIAVVVAVLYPMLENEPPVRCDEMGKGLVRRRLCVSREALGLFASKTHRIPTQVFVREPRCAWYVAYPRVRYSEQECCIFAARIGRMVVRKRRKKRRGGCIVACPECADACGVRVSSKYARLSPCLGDLVARLRRLVALYERRRLGYFRERNRSTDDRS